MGLEIASALKKLYPNDYKANRLIDLMGNQAAFDALNAGVDPRKISQDAQEQIDEFVQIRKKYLLY
jgi:uncharacterized protein YbbC (DUF1343 family)